VKYFIAGCATSPAVHPVDALHLEHHMIGEDIGDGAR
jgi:hypothetical protein